MNRRFNPITLLPESNEESTCDRPDYGNYLIQLMDTSATIPVRDSDNMWFTNYDKAYKEYLRQTDLIIAKKIPRNWVFLTRVIGKEYHLLEEFGIKKDN